MANGESTRVGDAVSWGLLVQWHPKMEFTAMWACRVMVDSMVISYCKRILTYYVDSQVDNAGNLYYYKVWLSGNRRPAKDTSTGNHPRTSIVFCWEKTKTLTFVYIRYNKKKYNIIQSNRKLKWNKFSL